MSATPLYGASGLLSFGAQVTLLVQRWSWLNLNNLLQVIGVSTGLAGNYLITQSNAAGFILWMVSNVALLWLQVRLRLWLMTVLFVVYFYLCFEGLAGWASKTPETIPSWVPSALLQFAAWMP